jgi:hypothetical protein
MVEIHEPVRLLFVIETTPAAMSSILDRNPAMARLVQGHWVQLATFDPSAGRIHLYGDHGFEHYTPKGGDLPEVASSIDWYRGWRDHCAFACIRPVVSAETASPPSPCATERGVLFTP